MRGVKGGRFDPVLNWYEILIEHATDISALLGAELQQFPQTQKEGFIKVLSAISCGLYSQYWEVVLECMKLLILLVTDFKESKELLAQALLWFLKTSGEEGETQ